MLWNNLLAFANAWSEETPPVPSIQNLNGSQPGGRSVGRAIKQATVAGVTGCKSARFTCSVTSTCGPPLQLSIVMT